MVRVLSIILALGLFVGACSQEMPSTPQDVVTDDVAILTPGQLHNELLARFHASCDRSMDETARIDMALMVSNEILAAYGEPAVSREQVVEWMALGRSLMCEAMQNGPLSIADRALPGEASRLWWRAFSAQPLDEIA